MGYIFPKNTFLQLQHYIQRIYLTLFSTTVKIHQIPYAIFETISHFLYFIFDKNIPSKCKFSDFPLLELKFSKLLMSFFKQKVSLSSKFGSLFGVMRDNSSVLFHLKLYMLSTKLVHQSENFQTFNCSHEN